MRGDQCTSADAAGFPIAGLLPPCGRVRAMKTYGMLLSDGGEIALTFADDRLSTAKWSTLGVDAQSFSEISPANFDVVDLGPEIPATFDCVRNP